MCTSNNKLESFEGAPKYVEGNLICHHNKKLKTIEWFPKYVDGSVFWNNNGIKVTEEEIRAVCQVGGRVSIT